MLLFIVKVQVQEFSNSQLIIRPTQRMSTVHSNDQNEYILQEILLDQLWTTSIYFYEHKKIISLSHIYNDLWE